MVPGKYLIRFLNQKIRFYLHSLFIENFVQLLLDKLFIQLPSI